MSTINDLPVEILQEVLYNLSYRDIVASSSVSRNWRNSSVTHYFWTKKLKKEKLTKLESITNCGCISISTKLRKKRVAGSDWGQPKRIKLSVDQPNDEENNTTCSNSLENEFQECGPSTTDFPETDVVQPAAASLENCSDKPFQNASVTEGNLSETIDCLNIPLKETHLDDGCSEALKDFELSDLSRHSSSDIRNLPGVSSELVICNSRTSQSTSSEDCCSVKDNSSEDVPQASFCDLHNEDETCLTPVCGLRTTYCKWQMTCERWLNGNTKLTEFRTDMKNINAADCDGTTFIAVERSGRVKIWDFSRNNELTHEFSVEGIVSNLKIFGDVFYMSIYKLSLLKTVVMKYRLTPCFDRGEPALQYCISAYSVVHCVWGFFSGRFAIAGGAAKKIRIFEETDGHQSQLIRLDRRINVMKFLWCSHLLIGEYFYGRRYFYLGAWNVESGESVWSNRLAKPFVYSSHLHWNIQESFIMCAHDDVMYVFDLASGATLAKIASKAAALINLHPDTSSVPASFSRWWQCMGRVKAMTRSNRKIRLADFRFTDQGSVVFRFKGQIYVCNSEQEEYWSVTECTQFMQGRMFWITDRKIVSVEVCGRCLFIIDLLLGSPKTNTEQKQMEEKPKDDN